METAEHLRPLRGRLRTPQLDKTTLLIQHSSRFLVKSLILLAVGVCLAVRCTPAARDSGFADSEFRSQTPLLAACCLPPASHCHQVDSGFQTDSQLLTLDSQTPNPGSPNPNPASRTSNSELVRFEASHPSMGTVYTVVAYGRDQNFLAEVVNQVFDEIDQLDEQMSNYKPQSELSTINRDAAQRDVTVSPELFGLIRYSLRASQESGGDFDITVGPLMKLWGFFRGQGACPARRKSPRWRR